MGKKLSAFGALGLGAALMYLLDPHRGRRRRSLTRDRGVHAGRAASRLVRRRLVDGMHRLRGLAAALGSSFRRGESTDEVLVARVRSRLGRVSRHPGPIDVAVVASRAILRGPVLAGEAPDVIAEAASTRGIRSVEDRLTRHESWEEAAAALGSPPVGRPPADERPQTRGLTP